MKKQIVVILLCITCLFCFTVSASAAFYDLGVTGAQTISTNEAADLFGDELGWTEQQIEAFKTGYTLTNISSTMVMAESYDGEGNLSHSYQFWYDEDGEFQYAMIDGSGVLEFRTDISGTDESFGTSESSSGGVTNNSGVMSGVISTVINAVKGVYSFASYGFNFMTNNALCLLMVGISLAGAGLGLVRRGFAVSRK